MALPKRLLRKENAFFLTQLSDLRVTYLHAHLLLPSGPHTRCMHLAILKPRPVRPVNGGRCMDQMNGSVDGLCTNHFFGKGVKRLA